MSALSHIYIQKKEEKTVSIRLTSFRDDALPNTKLADEEDIANTGFTLFVQSLCDDPIAKQQLVEFWEALNRASPQNWENRYFDTAYTAQFIEKAGIITLKGDDSFDVDDLILNITQRQALYDYMGFSVEEGDDSLEENFFVNLFKNGDAGLFVQQIIGAENFDKVVPHIEMELSFINSNWLKNFNIEFESESQYDSFIKDWLEKV